MRSAIGLGNILAFIISYRKWHSILWPFFMAYLVGAMFFTMDFSIGENEH
ncbi:hypothetical protein [Enterococcus malodoratus]|nr:hypothetical protein [Enterococcus malodoratus]